MSSTDNFDRQYLSIPAKTKTELGSNRNLYVPFTLQSSLQDAESVCIPFLEAKLRRLADGSIVAGQVKEIELEMPGFKIPPERPERGITFAAKNWRTKFFVVHKKCK